MTLPSQKRTIFSNPWLALLVAFAVTAVTAITSMMDEKSRASIDLSMDGSRQLYGLVIATSHYQFGSPLYSFYTPVFDIFYTKQTHSWEEVNGLIGKARAIDPKALTPDTLNIGFGQLNEDDKGTIAWYWSAFKLFGPHIGSIYLLYFVMLFSSLTVFWLAFKKDPPALMLMALYPLVHLLLAAFTLASNTNVTGSLLAARPFAMLAALPALHLALLILRKRPPSRWLVAGAALQILYLLLIIAVRSSAKIQLLFILLVAAFALLCWLRKGRHGQLLRAAFVWVPLSLFMGLAGMALVHAILVPSELRTRTSSHLVWYPALAGFVANPDLKNELLEFAKLYRPVPYSGNSMYEEDGTLKANPSSDALARISVIGYAQRILHEDIADAVLGGVSTRNPNTYEHYAKRMFFYELRHRPLDMLHLYVWDKSRSLLGTMKGMASRLLLADVFAATFLLGLLGGAMWLQGLKAVAPLLAIGFGVSSIPAYWFMPAPHVMYDYAPYFYLILLSLISAAGAWLAVIIARHALLARLKPLLRTALPISFTLAIAGILLVTRLPGAGDKSTIVIIAATYGGNVKAPPGNATEPMRRRCNGREKCSYKVDVNKLGDPMGGAGKDFVVEYECSYALKPIRQTIPAEAHNHKITLDCRV